MNKQKIFIACDTTNPKKLNDTFKSDEFAVHKLTAGEVVTEE